MITRNSERGASAIVFILFFALALGAYLFMSSEGLLSSKRLQRAGSDGQRVAAMAMARLKDALANRASCSATFNAFRNFSINSSPLTVSLARSVPCLVDQVDANRLDHFEIRLQQTLNDRKLLMKQVKATLTLKTKPHQGLPGRTISLTRVFRVSIPSIDYFSTVFTGGRFPLVSSNNPIVTFADSVFYANSAVLSIDDITPLDGNLRVNFRQPFLARPRSLRLVGDDFDGVALRATFARGIETGVLNSTVLANYLPKNNSKWNYGIDYSPISQGIGFPIPHGIDRSSAIDCKDDLSYQPAAANVRVVPAPAAAAHLSYATASQTCMESPDGHPYIYMQPDADLTVNLGPGDPVFCGAIVARTLKITANGSGRYALLGFFVVQNIVVTGSNQAEVLLVHPLNSGTAEFDLPAGISPPRIAAQFESLSASMMRNFFLPFASNSAFSPWGPDDYLEPCTSPSGVARRKFRSTPYQPIQDLPGFANLQTGSANPLFIVDSAL